MRGTVGYMSPELILAGNCSASHFSLCAMLTHLTHGTYGRDLKSSHRRLGLRSCPVHSIVRTASLPVQVQQVTVAVYTPRPSSTSTSTCRDILEKSARGDYTFEGREWEGVSAEAKDLVSKMLHVDADKRITCAGKAYFVL